MYKRQLIIGSDNYVPYSYLDSDGNFTGIDVEIAREACRRMGYTPVFKQIVWDNKDIYLKEGAVDCLWAVSYTHLVYKCNDSVNISDFEITVQKVIIDKTYDEIELEASQYFKTEWIQKGSLSNYNSENMSLVYVYIKVKNIASNTAECPIGMASIGNYYDDNKYYRLSECAAIYPSSYERTTHCLYDDINAGEEKVYIVLFKVLDNYTDNDGSYSQLLINPCLELEINPATQGKKAPLVILDNISRE